MPLEMMQSILEELPPPPRGLEGLDAAFLQHHANVDCLMQKHNISEEWAIEILYFRSLSYWTAAREEWFIKKAQQGASVWLIEQYLDDPELFVQALSKVMRRIYKENKIPLPLGEIIGRHLIPVLRNQ